MRSEEKLGELIVGSSCSSDSSKHYDGCIGQLQRNESDTMFPMIQFPLIADGIQQGFLVLASRTIIGSVYNNSETGHLQELGVMSAFMAFDALIWIMIFMSLLTTAVTLIVIVPRVQRHASKSRRFHVLKRRTSERIREESRKKNGWMKQLLHTTSFLSMILLHQSSSFQL